MMKSKMMAGGGMKSKMMTSGGKMGYADGGMPMVERDGKKIPAFAADGRGKMAGGGMSKMMASGGMSKMMASGGMPKALKAHEGKMKKGGMAKKMNMGGMGYARGGGIESKGKTKGKII